MLEDIALWTLSAILLVSFIVKVLKTTHVEAARRLGRNIKAHPVKAIVGWGLGVVTALFIILSLGHLFDP